MHYLPTIKTILLSIVIFTSGMGICVISARYQMPTIRRFTIEQPFFVVYGRNLSKVEIWEIPLGEALNQQRYIKRGESGAALSAATKDGYEQWKIPVLTSNLKQSTFLAKGFDRQGKEVNIKHLTGINILTNTVALQF